MKRVNALFFLVFAELIIQFLTLRALSDPASLTPGLLKRVTATDIVCYLRSSAHVKISFQKLPANTAIFTSLKDAISDLEKIPVSEQTEDEKERLESLKSLQSGHFLRPDDAADFKEKRFDINLRNADIKDQMEEILKQICVADDGYYFELSDTMWILKGKDPDYDNKKFSFSLNNVSPAIAVSLLQKTLKQCNVFISPPTVAILIKLGAEKPITLNLESVSLKELLNRVSEAFGSDIIWDMNGNRGGWRQVSFLEVNPGT